MFSNVETMFSIHEKYLSNTRFPHLIFGYIKEDPFFAQTGLNSRKIGDLYSIYYFINLALPQ
jgi:hypothetical protein